MNKKYIVRLTAEERGQLEALVKRGKGQAYKIKHANILLKADADGPGWSDERMAEAFGCHLNTPKNLRQRFVEEGFSSALERKPQERPSRERLLDGEKQARLIALSCSTPPPGRARWTLHLLAGRLVEMRLVESISHETVRQALKKTN
jgi:transposase